MKTCRNCGSEFSDDALVCTKCGSSNLSTENQINTMMPDYTVHKKKSGKKTIAIVGIISAVLIITATRFAGGLFGHLIGNTIGNTISDNTQISELDSFINNQQNYVPGILTDEKYISDHFDIQFEIDEKWIMYSESDLEESSALLKESTLSAGVSSLSAQGVSNKIIEKWKNTVYAKDEMSCAYVSDDIIVGEVTVSVFSTYGIDEHTSKKIMEGVKSKIGTQAYIIDNGEKNLAGKTYDYASIAITSDGNEMTNQIFLREEDGMICMITCKSLEGYENQISASFTNLLKAY